MTRRRWIADEHEGDRAWLRGSHAQHLTRVLRAQVGQQFEIACGERVRMGRVVSVADDAVEFALAEDVAAASGVELTLVVAVFKFDRLEWAIEKCTELGVAKIVPVIARRTDAHLAHAAEKRVERWRRLALQASEQSRRVLPPEIADPVRLTPAVLAREGTRMVLAEAEKQILFADALASARSPLTIAVGPEGGWTSEEMNLFAGNEWKSVSLGATIVRAETAAIAAVAIAGAMMNVADETR